MPDEPIQHADGPDDNIDVGRYLRFVVSFLLILFGALGIYQYYYGAEARKLEEFRRALYSDNADVATSSVQEYGF